jgi:hypothetical protein
MLTYIVTLMQILILIAAGSLFYDFANYIFQFDEGDNNEWIYKSSNHKIKNFY